MSVSETAPPRAHPLQVPLLGVLAAIQVSDPLITTLTLVKASDELNFSASLQSLAAGISTFALAATVIPSGVLADRLGRRTVLAFSVLVASAGQVLTALGPDASVYLLGRIITGVALGATFAAAYGMITTVSSQADRGPALATFNIVAVVVPLIVLVVTGPVAAVDWRLAFAILPVVSLVAFPLTWRVLPAVPRVVGGPVDYLGMVLIATGIAGLLVGISAASAGVERPEFWLPMLLGAVALAWFVRYDARAASPVFPVRLLTHPAFVGAAVMGVLFNFASSATSQMTANFWQYVVHLPTAVIGIASLPTVIVSVIASAVAGRLLKAGVATLRIAGAGVALVVVGFALSLLVTKDSGYAVFVPMLAFTGFGMTLVGLVQSNLFLTLAPARFFGAVTSSRTAVGQFGYSLGLTGTTVLVSIFTIGGVRTATHGAVSGDGAWDSITSYLATGSTTDTALAAISHSALAGIYTQAFIATFLVSALAVALAGLVVVLSLRRPGAGVPVDDYLGSDGAEPTAATH